jgi:hypothetical protein
MTKGQGPIRAAPNCVEARRTAAVRFEWEPSCVEARRTFVVHFEWVPHCEEARRTAAVRCERAPMFAVHWSGLRPSFLVLANVWQSWILFVPADPTFVAEMIVALAAERLMLRCPSRRLCYLQVCA